jgi:hypothetical protein
MSLGDRRGFAGLILALVGIAITILWPTARGIGWIAIAAAVGLGICWGVLEFKRPKEVPSFVLVFGAPLGGQRLTCLDNDAQPLRSESSAQLRHRVFR